MICELCPRNCKANRNDKLGFCGMGNNVLLAKAENADKREEAKKRVINVVIAIVVTVVLVLLMKLFVTYAPDIIKAEKPKPDQQGGQGGNVIGAFIDYAKVMLIK